jgi:hypothetical protein
MSAKNYYITPDQLEVISHHKMMFELNAELINDICRSEKDDIVYGFELGKMFSHFRNCFISMMELEDEITKQQLKK